LSENRQGELVAGAHRSIRSELAHCDALVLGPGMRDGRFCRALLRDYTRDEARAKLIIDGAALAMFSAEPRRVAELPHACILTPHAGEMAKMCALTVDEVRQKPRALALEYAQKLDCVLVLKGASTYIAAPDGRLYESTNGNLGLGTSGSGDTLAGIIAGLCARGAEPVQAAVWGVYLHASAGDTLARTSGQLGYLAREIPAQIPAIVEQLSVQKSKSQAAPRRRGSRSASG
jgi:hydroxyethylthiazole kinase-like uncharacterized protein yjeF